MDILKVLTRSAIKLSVHWSTCLHLCSQDMDVKRKAIGIALEMVTSRNVEDVVLFLKKQLQGTMDQEFDKVG